MNRRSTLLGIGVFVYLALAAKLPVLFVRTFVAAPLHWPAFLGLEVLLLFAPAVFLMWRYVWVPVSNGNPENYWRRVRRFSAMVAALLALLASIVLPEACFTFLSPPASTVGGLSCTAPAVALLALMIYAKFRPRPPRLDAILAQVRRGDNR